MHRNDFDLLAKSNVIGLFESCEITQLFIHRKSDNSVFNLFILASFEECPFVKRGHCFLTPKKGIKIDSGHNLCIQRYHLSISEAEATYNTLSQTGIWEFDGDNRLVAGSLKELKKQFIPAREGQLINHVLKNNFHSGSYILEFFDESKENLNVLLEMNKLNRLHKLNEEIKLYVPIDLSLTRDRVGNIIFQFPITSLKIDSKALSSWEGIRLFFHWRSQNKKIPDCMIQVESILDKNYMGSAFLEYNKLESQEITIGNLDQINNIKVWHKNLNLLLYTFSGTYIREFQLDAGIISHEPRIFEIEGKRHKISISSKDYTGGRKKSTPRYTEYINNRIYDTEKKSLEKNLSFKQYFDGEGEMALNDLRTLVSRNNKNGVYLWDPYLRSNDILKTLFFSNIGNVSLKAIGSVNSKTKALYETDKGKNVSEIINNEAVILNNTNHNNYGLNLEFRMQHTKYGWAFHDRFLMFPGNKTDRPKAYSLGISINNLGESHHIVQEVSHPQPVIDAFEQLWDQLNHKDCIVWKFPKK